MKKSSLVSLVCLFITASGLKPALAPVKAAIADIKQTRTTSLTKPQVFLIDAGIAPRKQLRFTPKVNGRERANMTLNMDMSMSLDNQSMPMSPTPGTLITIDTQVMKVAPNGDIHYEFTYSDVKVVGNTNTPREMVDYMRSQIKGLIGTKGTVVVDNRGQTKQASVTLPPNLPPTLRQSMEQITDSLEQISSPLPIEAVGIGGQWRVVNSLNMSGMTLEQTAIYKLVSFKNNTAVLNVTVQQQAPPNQTIKQPNLPAGTNVKLKSYSAKGRGQTIAPLNLLMPQRSHIVIDSNSSMEIEQAGNPRPVPMVTKLSMQIEIRSQS
jgi:hypothetical protein